MKALLYISLICLTLFSCSKDENDSKSSTTVVGKWKQIESYQSDGGSSPAWSPISNGYTLEFLDNGTFTATKFTDCQAGTYSVSTSNQIVMVYSCENFTTNDLQQIEAISGSQIILKPTDAQCDEGCAEKFQRIQ